VTGHSTGSSSSPSHCLSLPLKNAVNSQKSVLAMTTKTTGRMQVRFTACHVLLRPAFNTLQTMGPLVPRCP